jgi:hypothetical protein
MTAQPGTGVIACPDCGHDVLYALMPSGAAIALTPDESGTFAGREDEHGTARCRPAPADGRLCIGEFLFAAHSASCSPALAEVIPIQRGRTRRDETSKRYA